MSERLEQCVERSDRSCEQTTLAAHELALDVLYVRTIRNDQPWIPVDRVEVAVEKRRDLAGMRGTDDEGETHRSMVVGRSPVPAYGRDGNPREKTLLAGETPRPVAVETERMSGEGLRPAATAGNGRARHAAGARITEIGLLRTTTRIVERHAKNGALSFPDFGPARITNENGLSSHDSLQWQKSLRRFPLDIDERSLSIIR